MNLTPVLLEAESASFWDKIVTFIKTQILSTESTLTTSQKFSLAGTVIIRGMATVFIVLITLWIVIAIFGAVSKATAGKKKAAPAPAAPVEEAPATSNDAEIVAAITAAIEAYRASEGLAGRGYRVVSFKKRSVKNRIGSDD